MLFSFFLWSYIGGCMVRGICIQDESMCMRACQCTFDRREQSDILQLFFTTNSHKPKHSNLQHARWLRLWKLHKRTISDPPEYPFVSSVPICMTSLFRPRAGVQHFGYVLPYGIVTNSTKQHRTVLVLHPYGLHKQTTF